MFEMYNGDLVSTRLSRSIIRIDDKYQFIKETGGNPLNGFFALTPNGRFGINRQNISYDNMNIGMVILGDIIYWSYRLPVRRWKAGLNANNYAIQSRGGERWVYVKKNLFEDNIDNIIDMLVGNYSPFSEAMLKGHGIISQHFSVLNDFVFYKSRCVAPIRNNRVVFV